MRLYGSWALLATACIALVGCSSNDLRVRSQQDLFDTYPPEVQQNIRDGVVEVGYTPEMVEMAVGAPHRKETLQTEEGSSEAWIYRKSLPGVGVGVGVGSGPYAGPGVGVGVGFSLGGSSRGEDRAVVEFRDGRVTRIRAVEHQ